MSLTLSVGAATVANNLINLFREVEAGMRRLT